MGACLIWPWPDARAEDPTVEATVTSGCAGSGSGICVENPDCGDPLPDQEQTRNSWSPNPSIDLGNPPCKPTGPTLICVGLGGYAYSISGYSDLDTYTPQKRTRSGSYDGECVWHWGAWSGWANDGSPQQAGDSTDVIAWHTTGGSITSAGVLTAPTAPGAISITATIDDAPASVSPPDVGTRDDSPVTSAALAVTVVAVTDLTVPGATEIPDGDTDNVNTKAYVIAKSDTAGATLVATAVPSSGPPLPGCWGFTGGTAVGDGLLQRSIPLDQPGAYTLDVTCGTSFKKAVVYVVEVDLDIANGGSDLDNGEVDNSPPSALLAEADEGDPTGEGAFLLVNWDDDDADGAINAAGSGWVSVPVPDLDENPVLDEDNLAKVKLSLTPAMTVGTLELQLDSGAASVKIWDTATKGSAVTDLDWDLATEAPPSELWVEGRSFSPEKGVVLKLRYKAPAGNEVDNDKVKATVVLIKLAVGLHREMASAISDLGHAGLLTAFTGNCTKNDLLDSAKYEVTEMQADPDTCVRTTWKAFHSAAPVYWGQYDNSPTYTQRLRILLAAKYIFTGGTTKYTAANVLEPGDWNGQLANVAALRCDGLVELCHEWSGLSVWGRIVDGATHYSLSAYLGEHNQLVGNWKKNLFPATQSAHESTYKGSAWDTAFSLIDAVEPLGTMNW
ncbi:MAG: hypothetical protein A3K18_28275 [Lentisphaerae bacterium RIFOXYA12_64_32]|nr:MAG: hypothetical protein A3K18_28275 [Lentisphaerae bacterium RIFOXYA12_64_32]